MTTISLSDIFLPRCPTAIVAPCKTRRIENIGHVMIRDRSILGEPMDPRPAALGRCTRCGREHYDMYFSKNWKPLSNLLTEPQGAAKIYKPQFEHSAQAVEAAETAESEWSSASPTKLEQRLVELLRSTVINFQQGPPGWIQLKAWVGRNIEATLQEPAVQDVLRSLPDADDYPSFISGSRADEEPS